MAIYVFKMAAVRHVEFIFGTLDYPRILLGDRKPVFKFRVDRVYSFEDMSDRTFRNFGLKRLFPPNIYVFGEF